MIPAVGGDKYGCLPPGRHVATLPEVYDRFVADAPYSSSRSVIWQAFELWAGLIWGLFPTAPLWVNGGFVTHKAWAAPKDVDVVATVRASEYNRVMTPSLEGQLWTVPHPDPTLRIQPMGGYVDGFVSRRGQDDPRMWDGLWSRVVDENHEEVVGRIKGYLEVLKP